MTLLGTIADVGRDAKRGGYSRPVHSAAENELREWFVAAAEQRGLLVEKDRNGILWAWWGQPGPDAVVTGSHLDSVPGGGAFDGPLGVASALAAIDIMGDRGQAPARPLAVAVFPEEEGSRFGVACLGSRLLAGAISPDKARTLADADGNTLADVYRANGTDPEHLGEDPGRLAAIRQFVELHIEQGRGQVDLDAPVAVGGSVLGHGRWRLSFHGQGNHAGTTLMADRADPMVAAASAVVTLRKIAAAHPGARGTVGRLVPVPGGTNVIASRVDVWLDVRHRQDSVTAAIVEELHDAATAIAAAEGCTATLAEESLSPTVQFDAGLAAELKSVLGDIPVMETGAGHDAGVLAARIPTAMLFVRNPTGVSHAPEEVLEGADADAGAAALADVLAHLTGA
ncbi:allantoate amidohydrolase [Arthrobacter sp. STN4]|uniref:allantoate amidohydrolase n=1 Tax=Arthrobacter sp. STN4 TaxID=2923276 RepID=UPI00211A5144|nr:allantoate amidohydrolase [Arthrobacter sp. STN4]MCQ9165967.1 allantoate amidohydrolase [Arthrobacter sp. STN4]